MSPRRPPTTSDHSLSREDAAADKQAVVAAMLKAAERLGPDGGGSVVTTYRLPRLLHTQLGLAAKIEPDYDSMNDIAVAALEEWFARHGYSAS